MWGDALVREGVRGRGGGLYKLGGGLRWFDFESGLYVRVDRLLLREYRRPRVGGLYVRLYVRLWGHGAACFERVHMEVERVDAGCVAWSAASV